MIELRIMNHDDIAAGLSLCRKIGWNQLARDWKQFLEQSPHGCRVALKDGNVVGTVTTIKYQRSFCWIGMVLVNPENQKQGIGKQLLHEALSILQNEETIKLDATPAGREVYLKLGFTDEYKLSRMTNTVVEMESAAQGAMRMIKDDLPAVAAFDKSVFGAERPYMLNWMLEGTPQLAFIARDNDEVKGYCMGRTGFNFTHIGPVIATDTGIAKKLLLTALQNCIGKPVALDALHFHPEWKQWLSSIGFTEQRELIRMYKGENSYPGLPEKQFTILGPEFG